jgi:imidazolonepropionase
MPVRGLRNCSQIVTMASALKKDGRKIVPTDLSVIEDGAVIYDDQAILWVGRDSELSDEMKRVPSRDMRGHVVTPCLVDSHTHSVFGGNRAVEYGKRLNGASYQEIAAAGGGILSTVEATGKLGRTALVESGIARIEAMLARGVGAIEVKSGYGLDYDKELELTLAIDDLKKHFKGRARIFNTFMAAHAVPKRFATSNDYMRTEVIPLMHKLADFKAIDGVDIFFEQGYFSREDTILLFKEAASRGLALKVHADEFNDNKGAVLACEHGALSCDHLLMTSQDGIRALAGSPTVGTLLPGTGLFLGKPAANARELFDSGAKMAIASDFNPGSCHCDDLALIASLAAPLYKLNLGELWVSITLNAAHALGYKDMGAIVPGHAPRFTAFKCTTIEEVTYSWGKNLSVGVI